MGVVEELAWARGGDVGGGIRGWRGMESVARVWSSFRKRMREEDSMVARGEECARDAWKGELTRMERMERGIFSNATVDPRPLRNTKEH